MALVIGNGLYRHVSPLANPVNDAEDLVAVLRQLGFELVGGRAHTNQTTDQMKQLIVQFGEELSRGGVGLFYYAGHGVQSQGRNYLIPVEANILREKTLEFDAVDVNRVLAEMDEAGNGFNIVIMDACRNNPFNRSWRDTGQGLAQVNAPEGTLIAYATSPGRVANDGTGRNGTYTGQLLRQMRVPRLTIEEMFKAVRVGVKAATANQQTPWESSSLVGEFCFTGLCDRTSQVTSDLTTGTNALPSIRSPDEEFWLTIRSSIDPQDFRAYLANFPSGRYAPVAQNTLRRLEGPTTNPTNNASNVGSTHLGSGADKSRDELDEKNKEIAALSEKALKSNEVVARTFKAGNEAFMAKNFDEAIKQYEEGLAADPEQPALLVNEARAYTARGVKRYNAAVTSTAEVARRAAGVETAKADFRAAAAATTKAVGMIKRQPVPTEPAELAKYTNNRLAALTVNAEAYRLFVSKADPTQTEAGLAAFKEYIAIETDPAKKAKAQLDAAQLLLDAGAVDKAFTEFQAIVTAQPDNPDANLGAGLALFASGDKAKYQNAADFLQHYVDVAPETHKFKEDAKAILAELKNTEKVVPQKTTPTRRRRP